MQSKQFSRN